VNNNTIATDDDFGPVLVTVDYGVASPDVDDLLNTIRQYRRIRRRDGAKDGVSTAAWRVQIGYLETFIVASWAEHLRQHERLTEADRETEEQSAAARYLTAQSEALDLRRRSLL
jgi:hypothetical protein